MYFDKFGCIVTKTLDGGDTVRFTAFHEILFRFTDKHIPLAPLLVNQIDLFHIGSGVWRRHPDKNKWYYDPKKVSRDQLIAILRALAMSGQIKLMLLTYLRILMRLGFAQNMTDWMLLSSTECVIRGLASKYKILKPLAYLILTVLDIFHIFNALAKCFMPVWKENEKRFESVKNLNEVDDDNIISYFIQAIKQIPTITSWIARKIYSKNRPVNYGVTELGIQNNVLAARAWYGREDTPELTELFKQIALSYFK